MHGIVQGTRDCVGIGRKGLTCELLLLLKHLGVEMVHSMRIGTCARGHPTHHGSGIHLATGSGHTHVGSSHLLWYAGLGAGLAGIMGHTLRHGMAWRDSRVLLHSTGMVTTWHSLHHGDRLPWSMIHLGGLSTPQLSLLSHAMRLGEASKRMFVDGEGALRFSSLLWRHDVTYDVSCREAHKVRGTKHEARRARRKGGDGDARAN